ncbi:Uncharacterised protein [Mycobacteroides abscessus subsp. abscessus]|nr:Uncharacterised protein [Mycobacteroides abscessus subsp. abscessus]
MYMKYRSSKPPIASKASRRTSRHDPDSQPTGRSLGATSSAR